MAPGGRQSEKLEVAQQTEHSARRYSRAGLSHLDISAEPGTLELKARGNEHEGSCRNLGYHLCDERVCSDRWAACRMSVVGLPYRNGHLTPDQNRRSDVMEELGHWPSLSGQQDDGRRV